MLKRKEVPVTQLDATERSLVRLRHQIIDDLALAAVAFVLALVASVVDQSLALPLLVGGVASACLALRAFWRRMDLIDRLALRRDAYAIPDVRAYGERCASTANRVLLASIARQLARGTDGELAEQLDKLAAQLEDEKLALAPECAVACQHLLTGRPESPLSGDGTSDDTLVRLNHILAGF
jgi:hypothetical protein